MDRRQSILKKLITADFKSNKFRNIFIVLAVFLTTFLLSATLSIGINFIENMRMEQFRQLGTMANFAFGCPTEQQLRQVEEKDFITASSRMINAGTAIFPSTQSGDITIELWYADENEWERMRAPTYSGISGSYPQEENEIMLSLRALKKLGISAPTAGMEIPLVQSGRADATAFILSGWYRGSQASGAFQNMETAYVSEALCNTNGRTVEEDGVAYFLVSDPAQTSKYVAELKEELQLSANQSMIASAMFSDSSQKISIMVFIGFLVFIFILSGYLIISNILYISLRRDIRYYGSLKALGATQRQISGIVLGQILRLSLIGILAGLVLTFIISGLCLPAILAALRNTEPESITSGYPQLIYPLAAVFGFATTILGAFRPVKKIAAISPVEAQRFVEISGKKQKKDAKRIGGNLLAMALRNIFRERKRAVMVISSLFLGLALFLVVLTAVWSLGTESTLESMMESDIVLTGYISMPDDADAQWGVTHKFDDAFMSRLHALFGIESVSVKYCATALVSNRDLLNRGVSPRQVFTADEDIPNWIHGVDKGDILRLNQDYSMDIDVEAFERGEFAIVASDDPELAETVKTLWIKPIPIGKGEQDALADYIELPVGGWVSESFKNADGNSMLHPAIFISSSYMEKLYGDTVIDKIYVNTTREDEAAVLASIRQMIQDDGDMMLSSRSELREMFQGMQFVLIVIGGAISGIICLIGLLNFANVMLMGIIARKPEFAALESIGMTKKQIRKLLTLEGLCYASIPLFFVWTIGNVLGMGVAGLIETTVTSATYVSPFLPMLGVSILVLLMCMLLPFAFYRSFNKCTIAERIRETM